MLICIKLLVLGIQQSFIHNYCSGPMQLKGEGTYKISNIKEFKVTEAFLNLDVETKGCQHEESFDRCMTKNNFIAITTNCNCVPYSMRNYSSLSNMKVRLYKCILLNQMLQSKY